MTNGVGWGDWGVPNFGTCSSFCLNDHTSTISFTDLRSEPPYKKGMGSTIGKYCSVAL